MNVQIIGKNKDKRGTPLVIRRVLFTISIINLNCNLAKTPYMTHLQYITSQHYLRKKATIMHHQPERSWYNIHRRQIEISKFFQHNFSAWYASELKLIYPTARRKIKRLIIIAGLHLTFRCISKTLTIVHKNMSPNHDIN